MKKIIFLLVILFISGCNEINSFEDCINAGNPAMESYPRQCMANGKTFVEDIKTHIPTLSSKAIEAENLRIESK